MEITVINGDAYLKSLAEMACGKTRFAHLDSSDFFLSSFDVVIPEGYKLPENFPACCNAHQSRQKALSDWFTKFPSCCKYHKGLQSAEWFSKDKYAGVVDKIMQLSQYTWMHIQACIEKDDWYEDITEFIDYNYLSFGSLPETYGCSVGLDRYLNYVKSDLPGIAKIKPNVPVDKIARLVHFIEGYEKIGRDKSMIDLNVLDATYKNWIKAFPFEISYFRGLKEHYEKLFPVLKGQPIQNRYSGQAKVGIKTEAELVEWLIKTTKSLLQKIDSSALYKNGVIEDSKQHTIDIMNESHRISQTALLGDFSRKESEYLKILKRWLENEKKFFKELASFIMTKENKEVTWRPRIQLPPLDSEGIFEEFVCDLFNRTEPSGHFEIFGKKGDRQKGIDILSTSTLVGIQCKKKDIQRRGLARELKEDFEEDIQKVLTLDFKLSRLIFTSTFQDNAVLEEYLQALKVKYSLEFDVSYIGWNSLATKAQRYKSILNRYFNFELPE